MWFWSWPDLIIDYGWLRKHSIYLEVLKRMANSNRYRQIIGFVDPKPKATD